MKFIKLNTWKIPFHFSYAIVNNDWSGLDEKEVNILKNFLDNNIIGDLHITDNNAFFSWTNDVTNFGSTVLLFDEYKLQ